MITARGAKRIWECQDDDHPKEEATITHDFFNQISNALDLVPSQFIGVLSLCLRASHPTISDNITAMEAFDFYKRENHILIQEFGDIDFYRRRELSMISARRKRKLILDVHWLNQCWALKGTEHTPIGTWKPCPPK